MQLLQLLERVLPIHAADFPGKTTDDLNYNAKALQYPAMP